MGEVRIYGRRRMISLLLFTVPTVVIAARSAWAQDDAGPATTPAPEPPVGYTMGAQGFLLDDGEFTPIQFPGAVGTLPTGINDRGQIVGIYDDQEGRSHGFLYERGLYRTIDHPDATGTTSTGLAGSGAFAINNRGQVAGAYVGPDNHGHVYLLDLKRNRFRSIPDPPVATDALPVGLNDRGQITIHGTSPAEEGSLEFLLDKGKFARIQFPGAIVTFVQKVNNRGEVVGVYLGPDSGQHGFIFRKGHYRTVDFPGADHTGVNDRNDRGQFVGNVTDGDQAQPTAVHGALLNRGKLTTFDYPGPLAGATATTAYDINNRGQIVGAQVPFPTQQGAAGADSVPGLAVPSTIPAQERDRAKERDRHSRPKH